MFYNQLHQGGIRALIDWDNTIFDNMVLPENVELADVVDHILYKYGDTPLFTPDPAIVKFYIGRWSARRLPVWNKYKELLEIEFNPLENYNRIEHTDNTLEVTKNNTGTQRFEKTGTDTNTNSGTDTTRHSGDDTTVKTGSIHTVNDDSKTTLDNAYNTTAWSNDKKEDFDGDKTETYNSVQDKLTHGESVSLTHGHTETIGYNTTDERTDNLVEFDDHSGSIDTNIHGNIGVMSSQDMFKQQIDIIPYYDLIEIIATDWHQEFNLYIY